MHRNHVATPLSLTALLVLVALLGSSGADSGPLYVLQSNDVDPTAPTSQPNGRWYHWIGVDPVVTHLETGIAVDAERYAGRGQRIDVCRPAPVAAVQVKIKRIGAPGAFCWEAGTARGRDDLGKGEVPARQIHATYEHFVTLSLHPTRTPAIYLRFRAASGACPDDYYAVYCSWRENHAGKSRVNGYDGPHEVGMMFRALAVDPYGAALEADGRPMIEGASAMTRLLTAEPGPNHRALLPGEEDPYAFAESLAAGEDPRWAGLPWPTARPQPGDIVIDPRWRIQVAAGRSPQVVTAVGDLKRFLSKFMRVPLDVVWETSAKPQARTITLTEGPNLADGPRRPAGYRFVAGDDRLHLHGFDARGVLRAVWYLEELLMLRGGPMLKPDARTREPRYSPRAACSAWGGMGELATSAPVFTDGHLSLISRYGHDAIWLGWYPGPERGQPLPTRIAPGRVPDGLTAQPFTSRLRNLVERAERYDLQVVILYTAPHPNNDAEKRTLQAEAKQFLRDVPKIRTIVLLDEGMGSVRKGLKAWVDTCSLLAQAFYEARPDVNVVAWRYSFASRTPKVEDWDRSVKLIDTLDRRVAYMANFDSFWARRRDGLLQHAFDYCLSLKAPSDDYRHAADYLFEQSQRDGKPPRPLWAKIESRFSQESNTQPEIPCMQRWVQRFEAANQFANPPIAGMIASWYHQGFFPTPVNELYAWLSYTNAPASEELLRAIARRDYGPGQEDAVLAAWRDFSEAIWHFPFYYGMSNPMNAGFAQPFWLDPKTVNPRPWRRGFVNSLKEMQMSGTGEGPGSGPENRARLGQLQLGWQAGLEKLHKAVAAAPTYVRSRADANWRVARSFGDKADVTLRLVRWFDARNRLQQAKNPAETRSALYELEKVGREELQAARAALPIYLRDSRLGHLNHGRGCFTALSIATKIHALEKTLSEELPALRAKK